MGGRDEQERERLERRLTALDREITRLIDAYQAEVIDLSELSDRRRSVEEQGRMLRQRLREIEQQRANRENELRLLEGVEAFCASVRESLEEPSFEVKQKVLQLVVDRIVVEESRVVIQHVVPTGPVSLQTEQQTVGTPLDSSQVGVEWLPPYPDVISLQEPDMPGPKAPNVCLSQDEREELLSLIRAHKTPQHFSFRAQVILQLADGHNTREVARNLGTSRLTVRRWRRHWLQRQEGSVQERLQDAPPPVQVPRLPSPPSSGVRSWRWPASPPKTRVARSAIGRHASWPMRPSNAALSRRFHRVIWVGF